MKVYEIGVEGKDILINSYRNKLLLNKSTHIETTITDLLQNQDKNSIKLIYENYGDALLGVIMRIVGEREVAEDIYQDSLIKIWKNGKKYDPRKGRLFTWLLNICRNTAIDYLRSAAFKNKQSIQKEDPLVFKSDVAYDINIESIGINDLVLKLESKYQEVIRVVYLQEYTHQEAAQKLALPLGTLKTRLRTAIKLLKELI